MPIQLNAQPRADFDRPIDTLEDCHRRIERFLRKVLGAAALDGMGLEMRARRGH